MSARFFYFLIKYDIVSASLKVAAERVYTFSLNLSLEENNIKTGAVRIHNSRGPRPGAVLHAILEICLCRTIH